MPCVVVLPEVSVAPNSSGDLRSPSELVIGRPSALRPGVIVVPDISGVSDNNQSSSDHFDLTGCE